MPEWYPYDKFTPGDGDTQYGTSRYDDPDADDDEEYDPDDDEYPWDDSKGEDYQ